VGEWLRATVDLRDLLDREAQQLGEEWPAFWAGVEAAAQQRVRLAGLDRDIARLRGEAERLSEHLRSAAGADPTKRPQEGHPKPTAWGDPLSRTPPQAAGGAAGDRRHRSGSSEVVGKWDV
jgi:hypothetical protein